MGRGGGDRGGDGKLRQANAGAQHNPSEQEIGGGEVTQEYPGRKRGTGRTGPQRLHKAGECFGVARIKQPSRTVGDEVETEGGRKRADQ